MNDEPRGVRGWLLLLCLALTVFGPINNVLLFLEDLEQMRQVGDTYPALWTIVYLEGALGGSLLVLALVAGISLWTVRPGAVRLAQLFLFGQLLLGLLLFSVLFTLDVPRPAVEDPQAWRALGSPIAIFLVWFTYLARSRRVRNTYGPRPTGVSASLAASRDVSKVVRASGRPLAVWVALGFLAGEWLAVVLSIAFGNYKGPLGTHALVVTRLAAGPVLAFAVTFVLGRAWRAWQQILVWMAAFTSIRVLQVISGHEWISRLETELVIGSVDWPLYVLSTSFLGAIFLLGLLTAGRLWGARPWSFAAGTFVGGFVGTAVVHVVNLYTPRWLQLLPDLLSSALMGAAIYVGVLIQAELRPDAGAALAADELERR